MTPGIQILTGSEWSHLNNYFSISKDEKDIFPVNSDIKYVYAGSCTGIDPPLANG
jgi:hypothetical protein